MDTIERPVVIAGSIAGLAAAATLSPRAREVVVVERHAPSHGGSVAAQGALPHVMLTAGNRVLEELFPGFAQDLLDRGAFDGSAHPTRVPCYWVAAGRQRDHLQLPNLGFPRALCSRRLLESRLRTATLALPNVTLLQAVAEGIDLTQDGWGTPTVTGVQLRGPGSPLAADFVVDASGRGSRLADWLEDAGLPRPPTTEVAVDLRYTAFFVERRPDDLDGAAFAVVQNTPDLPRIGVALPMEGDGWQVALGGYFGDAAPADPVGAGAFAGSLADPVLSELVDRPYLSRPARFTFRSSRRQHWEKLSRHPRSLCVVGDAVANFNPIYGQGMTSALLQIQGLGAAIDQDANGTHLALAFARAAAKVADSPWLSATGADFIYDKTQGRRPLGAGLVNRYLERVTRAAAVDEEVNAAFTDVQQLLASPQTLFRPHVAARALRHGAPAHPRKPRPTPQPVTS